MVEMDALIARVGELKGPDGEVDRHIWTALRPSEGEWQALYIIDPEAYHYWILPGVLTGSVDGAVALLKRVLPGWSYKICEDGGGAMRPFALVRNADRLMDLGPSWTGRGPTPAIALLMALLKAKKAMEASDAA